MEPQQEKSASDYQISEEELAEMIQRVAGTTPTPDEKQNVHTFLNNIVLSDDTSKIGYLKDEELGNPVLPVRSDKSLALWSGQIMNNPFFEEYFNKESEDTTSTSLSRDGFLVKQATLQKREVADLTKPKKENKGWFRSKEKEE